MDQIAEFFDAQKLSGWDLLFALLVLIAGWIVASLVKRAILAIGGRWPQVSPPLVLTLARVAKYFVWLIALGVALAFLGANVQPLLASVVIVLVVLALALRGIAGNFGAGVVLQARRPFTVGDEIEVQGIVGVVRDLNSRSVVVHTRDGRVAHVPNSDLLENPFWNNSEHAARRSEIRVRVSEPGQRDALETLLVDAAEAGPLVHNKPRPSVLFTELSPERASARVLFWHAPLNENVATSQAVTAVADALTGAGFSATVQSEVPVPPLVPPPSV
ncbi:mechanosensitive ion channel domain-containing protein [Rathayibacter sp. YIM 133350]|uniref:mechanosensitive ion channel family protein n=1 Tax=Rathayibacter sp. YIM 133350 TaxID=3131992 RepID=UPI00307FB459